MSNKKPLWIDEDNAATMLCYQPRTLRRKVKNGQLNIAFSSPTGRKFLYNLHDIERVLLQHSNLMEA